MAQESNKPRLSATDTSYLSCRVWTGHGWTAPTSRSARTPLAKSPKGFQAYGEVSVAVHGDGSCENTTTIRVASGAGQKFRVVHPKPASISNGNGIRLIGWSPNGEKLLAEVNLWTYDSDTGHDHVPFIYDASTGSTQDFQDLDQVVSRHFGADCLFEFAVTGWEADDQILIKVSKSPEEGSDELHSCVQRPQTFAFSLRNYTLQAFPNQPPQKD